MFSSARTPMFLFTKIIDVFEAVVEIYLLHTFGKFAFNLYLNKIVFFHKFTLKYTIILVNNFKQFIETNLIH